MKLQGHTVLVTGGTSGIGAAIAEAFHDLGNTVYVCARNPERLAAFSQKNPGIQTIECDIQHDMDVEQIRAQIEGNISVLVNNAGILQNLSFLQDADLVPKLVEVDINLCGMLRMIDAFLPDLAQKPGAAIVNVTSATAFIPEARAPIYSATKAAQHALTICLRHQLKSSGVMVVELIPPLTDTPMAASVEGIPKLSSARVATALIRGLRRNRTEIAPGIGRIARILARVSPAIAFSALNKS